MFALVTLAGSREEEKDMKDRWEKYISEHLPSSGTVSSRPREIGMESGGVGGTRFFNVIFVRDCGVGRVR